MDERAYHDHHYERDAARIFGSAIFQRVHDRAARQFFAATGAGAGQEVLSLGCGDASLELRLAPRVGRVVGVDVSPVAIERARARAQAAGVRNVEFHVAQSEATGLQSLGRFDVVAAFAFLHHLEDAAIRDTLRAARRALRPGGVLYSTDPSRRRFVRRFAGLVRERYERYHSPDERELGPEALAALAAEAGFARPAIGYTDYFLGPLAWLVPGTPRALARMLETLDDAALALPRLRRHASSFSLLAHA